MNPYEISVMGMTDDPDLVEQIKRRVCNCWAQHQSPFVLDEQAFLKEAPAEPGTWSDVEILRLRRKATGPEADEKVAWSASNASRLPVPTRHAGVCIPCSGRPPRGTCPLPCLA
jgi:hypothetical protein